MKTVKFELRKDGHIYSNIKKPEMSVFVAFHVKDLIDEMLNNDALTFEWANDTDCEVIVSSGVRTYIFDAERFTEGWDNMESLAEAIQYKIDEIREWYNKLTTSGTEFTFK